jgi:CBS-domain-containing membrane protein
LNSEQGAAAVLNFYAIESPLAQPRNTILGQIIASIVGVGICKLFLLSPHFESIRWIGGALACAAATAIMSLTKTVHPPAGSTALLAVVTDEVIPLGWWMVPMALLGSVLMVSVGLIVNNIQRTFPIYWWTPEDLTGHKPSDVESKLTPMASSSTQGTDYHSSEMPILIRPGQVIVPDHVYVTEEEKTYLEELSGRLR